MKKLFAMLLSVAVILSTLTIPAYAETGSPTDNNVVFSVENVTAAPGTDVSVALISKASMNLTLSRHS